MLTHLVCLHTLTYRLEGDDERTRLAQSVTNVRAAAIQSILGAVEELLHKIK